MFQMMYLDAIVQFVMDKIVETDVILIKTSVSQLSIGLDFRSTNNSISQKLLSVGLEFCSTKNSTSQLSVSMDFYSTNNSVTNISLFGLSICL